MCAWDTEVSRWYAREEAYEQRHELETVTGGTVTPGANPPALVGSADEAARPALPPSRDGSCSSVGLDTPDLDGMSAALAGWLDDDRIQGPLRRALARAIGEVRWELKLKTYSEGPRK